VAARRRRAHVDGCKTAAGQHACAPDALVRVRILLAGRGDGS